MASSLDDLAGLGDLLTSRAREAGVLLIWRAQERVVRQVAVRDGKTESSRSISIAGHGAQVIDASGRVALASRDDFREAPARELLERAIGAARGGTRLGLEPCDAIDFTKQCGRQVPLERDAFAEFELPRAAATLARIEREIRDRVSGVTLQLSFRAEWDGWRIFRSDGSDVQFAMPRCALSMRATSAGGGDRHGVSASLSDPSPGMLDDDAAIERFLARALGAARLAVRLPAAPAQPAGSFPLVIDYALAKGLAHEAFGHAAEADGYRSSILAENGQLMIGRRVGAEHVSVIDEPVAADHAWQPYSSNAVVRERAVIVDHGCLRDGLSDPWSAAAGGVRLTGAGRAESFRHAPQPRMTNIRIEVDEPLEAAGRFEDYDAARVQQLLDGAGVFRRHPRVRFLSGYSGGQVNTATGDFVFQCKAIYELGRGTPTLYRPAIFSGSMFGALGAIREAFGPLMLDAIGYCGKWGQSVPSSGGSHFFLVLDPDPSVLLGGS